MNMNNPAAHDAVVNGTELRMVINESVAYHTLERNMVQVEVLDDKDLRIQALNAAITLANRSLGEVNADSVVLDAAVFFDFLNGEFDA